jgi:hypothetical protein
MNPGIYILRLIEITVNLKEKHLLNTRVYPKVSGLAAWSENCKW